MLKKEEFNQHLIKKLYLESQESQRNEDFSELPQLDHDNKIWILANLSRVNPQNEKCLHPVKEKPKGNKQG